MIKKHALWRQRSNRVRHQIGKGTAQKPRLVVFRSNAAISLQIIDDVSGKTLATAFSLPEKKGGNIAAAKKAGQEISESAKKAGISEVIFDRNGYLYHGRIKAVADAAREGGLHF